MATKSGSDDSIWINRKLTSRKDIASNLPTLVFNVNVFDLSVLKHQIRETKLKLKEGKTVNVNTKGIIAFGHKLLTLHDYGFRIVFIIDKRTHKLDLDITSIYYDNGNEDLKKLQTIMSKVSMLVPFTSYHKEHHSNDASSIMMPKMMRRVIMKTLGVSDFENIIFWSHWNKHLVKSLTSLSTLKKTKSTATLSRSIFNAVSRMNNRSIQITGTIMWGISRWRKLNAKNKNFIGSIFQDLQSRLLGCSDQLLSSDEEGKEEKKEKLPAQFRRIYVSRSIFKPLGFSSSFSSVKKVLEKDVVKSKMNHSLFWTHYRHLDIIGKDNSSVVEKKCEQHSYYTVKGKYSTSLCPTCADHVGKTFNTLSPASSIFDLVDVNMMWDMDDGVEKNYWHLRCHQKYHVTKLNLESFEKMFVKNEKKEQSKILTCKKCEQERMLREEKERKEREERLRKKKEEEDRQKKTRRRDTRSYKAR
jgi:hypothetical protein